MKRTEDLVAIHRIETHKMEMTYSRFFPPFHCRLASLTFMMQILSSVSSGSGSLFAVA